MRVPSSAGAMYAGFAVMQAGFATRAAAHLEPGWLAWDLGFAVFSALMAWREW